MAELMADFRVDGSVSSVEDAEAKIQLRYQSLLDNLVDSEEVADQLRSTSESKFPFLFASFARFAHEMLYREILSNAGSYRLPTDPKGGSVYFGTQSKGQPEFSGTPAGEIEKRLTGVFRHLTKNTETPIASAVNFYQKSGYPTVYRRVILNGSLGVEPPAKQAAPQNWLVASIHDQ